jgi:RNA-binding protein
MTELSSGQRKFLRSQAHHLDPAVLIGKQGVTDTVIESVNRSLLAHELIKVRFNDHKDRKKALTQEIAERARAQVAGIIGHVAILYREHPEAERRTIRLPQ